jgi:hypothetical protein
MWLQDVFYKVDKLSLSKKIEIMNYAKSICFKWWVDKLDCSVSISRQKIDMSFDEIIEKFTNKCHFVIIHRRGDTKWKDKDKDNLYDEWCGEIGFCTMGLGIDYYLWIYITEEQLENLINKFNLEPNL